MGEASDRGFNRLRPIFAREVEEAGEEEDLSILVGLRPLLGVGLEAEKLSSCGGRRVWIATEEEEEGDPSIHLLTEHRRPRVSRCHRHFMTVRENVFVCILGITHCYVGLKRLSY